MSVANAPAEMPAGGPSRSSGYECPECLQPYVAVHPRQIFCCDAHKKAWEARSRLRARQLYPFATVARLTRGGTRGLIFTGRRALADQDVLIQRWRDEDAAAGRMSAVDFLNLRYTLGYERP